MSGSAHGPQPLIAIVGPTGVGKTRVAVELALRLGGELVGADSMQVYRGFDIGSAKPSHEELRGVRHHLIDVADPEDNFDAVRYAALADTAIEEIRTRGAFPIVVGGTGLWLRALLRGLVAVPAVDAELRASLADEWDALGALEMHTRLAKLDPISASRIHLNDKLRVVRALEVHAQTGQALGALRDEHALGAPRYRDLTVVLDLPASHYAPALASRTRAMIERGFADEVERLVGMHGEHVRPLQAVGYKQMLEHVLRAVPLDETEAAIVRATSVYARRQRTWWKSDPNVRLRMTPADAMSDAALAQMHALLAASR